MEAAQAAGESTGDEAAASLKQQGNDCLKAGKEEEALGLYRHALELATKKALQSQLHSNCAHVLLKSSGREEEALSHCDGAIQCDASNVKAYWRGATAAQRLDRHATAADYCTRGLAIEADNKELRLLLKKSKTKLKGEAAEREKAEGDRLFDEAQASAALQCYDEVLRLLGEAAGVGQEDLMRGTFERKARCHLELGEWWPAVLACERAALYCEQQPADTALCEGQALRELGLLHTAEEKFRHAESQGGDAAVEAQEVRQEVLKALQAVDEGQIGVVMEEVERLRKALPEKEAVNWMYTAKVRCESEEGRQEMMGHGFLKPEWTTSPQPHYTARCVQKLLLYQVKKKLQQELSTMPLPQGKGAKGGPLAVQYTFASPGSLRHPNASLILRDRHLEDLRSRGLTVVDQAFDEAAMARLRGECEWLDKTMGILLKDDEDVCNPLQRRFDIPLGDRERVEASRKDTPVLFEIIDHLRGLPVLLEEKLGLQLRVPQTVMLACYPKGAFYRKHLDSYEGKDIPRKVTILLYCNPDWTPGDGGALKAWLGNSAVEIEPTAGRIVVFMSQDIWHEVTQSQKERYALTLWVWDVKKDTLGR